MTPAVKEIRVLARGVKVLETLCRLGACSLAELHRETALPKSTLRRILFTFERANFLRCSLGDGHYRANIQVPAFFSPADASPFIGRIAASAKPVLAELSAKASWPTDLMVRDGLQCALSRPIARYRRSQSIHWRSEIMSICSALQSGGLISHSARQPNTPNSSVRCVASTAPRRWRPCRASLTRHVNEGMPCAPRIARAARNDIQH